MGNAGPLGQGRVPHSGMATASEHKLLLAASEVVPFAKTGGLADVAGSLPRALSRRGWQCAIVLPLYNGAWTSKVPLIRTEHSFTVPIGNRSVPGALWQATLPDSTVTVYRPGGADK